MVNVYPAPRCTSPLRVVPVGLGDGVGDCHDRRQSFEGAFFLFPLFFILGEQTLLFFQEYGFWFFFIAVYASS